MTLEQTVKIDYDQQVDVLRILLRDAPIEESQEEAPGVIVDYDATGHVIGVEILLAKRQKAGIMKKNGRASSKATSAGSPKRLQSLQKQQQRLRKEIKQLKAE